MVKKSVSNTKYVIFGKFFVNGFVDKVDLIGSFFGQTEGLLGEELEFNHLQKNGKIGRIEIDIFKKQGNSQGSFKIPTALDKVEVSLVAAAIESIEKIGNCQGSIEIMEIKDERVDKRKQILSRAEELLKNLKEGLPNSQEMSDNIVNNFKTAKVTKYNRGEFFGSPKIYSQKEIILVEGRADVLNLLKNDVSNVICFNGSGICEFIIKLCKGKKVTAFLDDDKGGVNELIELNEKVKLFDFCFAPNGKEVEDLSFKEIWKCLDNKTSIKDFNDFLSSKRNSSSEFFDKVKNVINKEVAEEIKDDVKKTFHKKKEVVGKNFEDLKTEAKRGFKDLKKKFANSDENTQSSSDSNSNNDIKDEEEQTDFEIEKDYFSKNEFEKILKVISQIKGKKEFVLLNPNYRKVKGGKISEFFSIEKSNGSILIFDGVCEGTLVKKINSFKIDLIICKSKSSCHKDFKGNVLLFKDFENM